MHTLKVSITNFYGVVKLMDVVSFGLYMSVHVTLSYCLTGKNICSYNDGKRIIQRCCSSFEEINNICVECKPGFFGRNCLQTCGNNSYGIFCKKKCNCNETQICHPVCGCLQRWDLNNSNVTNDNSTSDNVSSTSSHYAELCPVSTDEILTNQTTSNTIFNDTASKQDTVLVKDYIYSTMDYIIGVASLCSVCFLFGIGILYRLHFQEKQEESRVQHNVLYDFEESPRIHENPSGQEPSAEPLYGTCNYDEACYSTLTLRVNNESVQEPCASTHEVFNDENIYELA